MFEKKRFPQIENAFGSQFNKCVGNELLDFCHRPCNLLVASTDDYTQESRGREVRSCRVLSLLAPPAQIEVFVAAAIRSMIPRTGGTDAAIEGSSRGPRTDCLFRRRRSFDDRCIERDRSNLLGLKAAAFRSASEFLAAYSPDGPGCLVLDVRMPGMSGLELQNEILARGIELPTIVVTGFGDVRMAVEAMKAGAMEFLEKPFRTQESARLHPAGGQARHDQLATAPQRRQVQQQLSILTRGARSP